MDFLTIVTNWANMQSNFIYTINVPITFNMPTINAVIYADPQSPRPEI